jgi:hypothetical protein
MRIVVISQKYKFGRTFRQLPTVSRGAEFCDLQHKRNKKKTLDNQMIIRRFGGMDGI